MLYQAKLLCQGCIFLRYKPPEEFHSISDVHAFVHKTDDTTSNVTKQQNLFDISATLLPGLYIEMLLFILFDDKEKTHLKIQLKKIKHRY